MGLFNWANVRNMKEGKGVKKRKEPAHVVFFGVLQRKFWRFITLNFIYLLAGLPTWIFMGAGSLSLLYFHLGRTDFNMFFPVMLCCIPLIALISGPATLGMSYVLRNFAREKHAWILADMFETASKNYVQGMLIGLINSVVAFALIYAYLYYGVMAQSLGIMNYILIILGFVFAMVRSYIFPMAVSYKLSLGNLYRYSLALSIMKFPQNLILQIFSLACILVVFQYPSFGIVISAFGGISLLGFLNVFYTDRVLLQNMDQENEQIYTERETTK